MKIHKYQIWIICLLLLTPLRAIFILFAPFLVLYIAKVFGFELWNTKNAIVTILFFLSSTMGLINGTVPLPNIILSLWIVYPILLCLFSICKFHSLGFVNDFIDISTKVLFFINFVGLLYGLVIKFSDPDIMGFAYGRHFSSQNGLALLNGIYFFYYINKFLKFKNNRKFLLWSIFFFFSFLVCECGLAIICLSLTLLYQSMKHLKPKYIFITILSITAFVVIIIKASNNFGYYFDTIVKLYNSDLWENDFRKIESFRAYFTLIKNDLEYLFYGVGPGGFNGRVAFLINKDADNIFTLLMGHTMPIFHAEYIHPLWDKSILSADLFNDGSRNKPFSSFLSILSEFGVVMFCLFLGQLFSNCKKLGNNKIGDANYSLQMAALFMIGLLLLDQYLESSEMIFFLIFYNITLDKKVGFVNKSTI